MEIGGEGPKQVTKNVFIGSNPDTGKKYFEKRKVKVSDPKDPPEEPPVTEETPPAVPTQSGLGGEKFDPNVDTSGWDYTDH